MVSRIAVIIVSVLVLVVGAALLVPHLVNWNEYKGEITTMVAAETGRNMTIGGNISLRLLPTPALSVNDITIANADGASSPDMVMLDALQVRVGLAPLFSGKIQVESIRVDRPTVYLETLPDGRGNWEFDAGAKPVGSASTKAAAGLSANDGIRLDDIEINDGTLVYINSSSSGPASPVDEKRITNINANIRARSLVGPFEASGRAVAAGVPLSFDVSAGELIEGRTVSTNLSLFVPGESRINLSGALIGLGENPRYKGNSEIHGRNLKDAVNAIAGPGSAPAGMSVPYSIRFSVDATPSDVNIEDIEIILDEKNPGRINASASASIGKDISFRVSARSASLDVESLIGTPSAGGADGGGKSVNPSPPGVASSAGSVAGFSLPDNINGSVDIAIAEVPFRGGNITNIDFSANMEKGEIHLKRARALLPGITEVTASGTARASEGVPVFKGDVTALSSKPGELASWLGVSLNGEMSNRIRQVSYKSSLALDDKLLTLSGINLNLDRSKITGGISLALGKRPSFGANVNVDSVNLDSYLASPVRATPAKPVGSAGDNDAGSLQDMAGLWLALRALNDFDTNSKISIGSLVHNGKTFNSLAFDGTLYGGELDVRNAAIGSFAGSSASISGKINGFGGVPELDGLSLKLNTADAARLAADFGVGGVPPRTGKVAFSATLDGSVLKPALKGDISATGGRLAVAGNLSLLPITPGFNGTVSLAHPDPARAVERLVDGYRPQGPLGQADISFDIGTNGSEHKISNIKGSVDGTELAGTVDVKTGGAKPQLSANLRAGAVYVDHFMPAGNAKKTSSLMNRHRGRMLPGVRLASFNQQQTEIAQRTTPAHKRWSRDDAGIGALNAVDGEINLVASEVHYGKHRLDNADIHATIENGILVADRVNATAYGGPVRGSAVVRAAGKPTLDVKLDMAGLDVGKALMAAAGQKGAGGSIDFNLGFTSSGTSAADLVSSLDGAGRLGISALDVGQGGKGNALSGVIGLVQAMNQLSLPQGGKKAGLAEVNTEFSISQGIARIASATISSAMGSGNASGMVDIAGWKMDVEGLLNIEPNLLTSLLSKGKIGQQEVPFSLKGVVDGPAVNFAVRQPAGAATGQVAPKPVRPEQLLLEQILGGGKKAKPAPQPQPQPQPQEQPQPAPQPEQKVKPEEVIIRNIMEGLMKR